MITRVSAEILARFLDELTLTCRWAGLLEYPPVDMSGATEVRSPGYARQQVTWVGTSAGLASNADVLVFTGLDTPLVVRGLGLFRDSGETRAMAAWGPFPEPIIVNDRHRVRVKKGTIGLRVA